MQGVPHFTSQNLLFLQLNGITLKHRKLRIPLEVAKTSPPTGCTMELDSEGSLWQDSLKLGRDAISTNCMVRTKGTGKK